MVPSLKGIGWVAMEEMTLTIDMDTLFGAWLLIVQDGVHVEVWVQVDGLPR